MSKFYRIESNSKDIIININEIAWMYKTEELDYIVIGFKNSQNLSIEFKHETDCIDNYNNIWKILLKEDK